MFRRMAMASFLVVCFVAPDVLAREAPESLTWVRYYRTQPGEAGEFPKLVKKVSAPTLDGLLKEQKLMSWGIAIPFTRVENSWTHCIWLSTADWAHMDEVIQAFEAAEGARSELENDALSQHFQNTMVPGSVYDDIFKNVVNLRGPEAGSAAMPRYIRVSKYRVKPWQEKGAIELYRQLAVPVYEKLISEGVVMETGFASREFMSDTEWTHLSWAVLGNLASMDKVDQAFQQASEARSEGDQKKVQSMVTDSLDMGQYQSQILRIIHLGGKAE